MVNRADKSSQRYEEGLTDLYTQEFSAIILKQENGRVLITPRNKLCVGEPIEIIAPHNSYHLKVKSLTKEDGESVEAIHGGTDVKAWMPFDEGGLPPYSLVSKIIS